MVSVSHDIYPPVAYFDEKAQRSFSAQAEANGKSDNEFLTLLLTEENIKFLRQNEAIELDKDLFNSSSFAVEQLMELAGLAVAIAIHKSYPSSVYSTVGVCCGPGNNGGDGLVAARHLSQFGYQPRIHYTSTPKTDLYKNLIDQCKASGIPLENDINQIESCSLIVDAVFGFSFNPPVRESYMPLLKMMARNGEKLVSIDIPSGWNVEQGPPEDITPVLKPDCLVSLTAPKMCAKSFQGRFHWLGGRFVPKLIAEKYALKIPQYPGCEQVVRIS